MNVKLFYEAIIKFVLGVLMVGLLVFIPANTINYWNGWLFMGLLFIPMFVAGIVMIPVAVLSHLVIVIFPSSIKYDKFS